MDAGREENQLLPTFWTRVSYGRETQRGRETEREREKLITLNETELKRSET